MEGGEVERNGAESRGDWREREREKEREEWREADKERRGVEQS